VLSTDPEGDQLKPTFNYAYVLGVMGYFQANSSPGIAVSQCARFASSARKSHEKAMERIGPDLKYTEDKALLLHPTKLGNVFTTDVYIDSDFAGEWVCEDPDDQVYVKSRTGFVIEIMGCPIQWVSKLQTNIATSTMEVEYAALGVILRAAIPLLDVIKYVIKSFQVTSSSILTFKQLSVRIIKVLFVLPIGNLVVRLHVPSSTLYSFIGSVLG
jgi:hypothetical protein